MRYTGTYALLQTAGGQIALIENAPEHLRRALCSAMKDLRVGFLTPPVQGGHVRVETAEGCDGADLLRAAGFYRAQQTQQPGVAFALVEASGYDAPQAVIANVGAKTASAVMPLPERLETTEAGLTAFFMGKQVFAWREDQPLTAERAALAAIERMREISDGTMEVGVGGLEIGLRKERGTVTGLSVGGPMEALGLRVWELEA